MVTFTAQQKREAVDRELSYRRSVFARMVEGGKMTQKRSATTTPKPSKGSG